MQISLTEWESPGISVPTIVHKFQCFRISHFQSFIFTRLFPKKCRRFSRQRYRVDKKDLNHGESETTVSSLNANEGGGGGGRRKKLVATKLELRLRKKEKEVCGGKAGRRAIYSPAKGLRNRSDLPREAPPNSRSYTQGRILASPPIGRHVARHCFIHACCTFLVYLSFRSTRHAGTKPLTSTGHDPDRHSLRRLYKWQRDRR